MAIPSAPARIAPDGNARFRHMVLHILNGKGAEMENARGEDGRGMTLAYPRDKMIERTDPAGRDDRNGHRIGDRTGQREVITVLGAVAIHRGQEDFARAEPCYLAGIVDRIEPGRAAA